MLARVYCASTLGVDARIIEVETNMSAGMPRYFLVGLPDRAVTESSRRIEAAVRNSGAEFPFGRVTVNLAPADLPKEGSAFDLPIAVSLLTVSGQVSSRRLEDSLIVGELALDGKLKPVCGVLPIALEARRRGLKNLVVPRDNGYEAAVVEGLSTWAFDSLEQVMAWLRGEGDFEPVRVDLQEAFREGGSATVLDFREVRGQQNVRRALEVAAAGSHNAILVGPPGSGKTMMVRRLPGILPPLTLEEALETTKIHSVAGLLPRGDALVTERPFRAPHHSLSDAALVGGGGIPRPGEISMAHNGVLFLDELPEFRRSALEVLRQPVERGEVRIARARLSVTYPSRIMLVASMNPSPSGDWYDPANPEGPSPQEMHRYLGRLSGPLLDRIDLHIEVRKVPFEELSSPGASEGSAAIRTRVASARKRQGRRFESLDGVYANAQMDARTTRTVCRLGPEGATLLRRAMSVLGLSARAYDRILKVSRTIADLEGSESIRTAHVAEAVQYRSLDREGWLR
ncbi:MAG: YifB family Mg chelatase-like AAA ATPase [Balneolaceae bacterium]|nr:YifB family Mg chelatase-like AAA ATPase [Balneolaceae bacterium]